MRSDAHGATTVNLTKTKTKGREGKATLIETIREAVEQYPRLFVFRYRNLRNNALKKLRHEMTANSRCAPPPPNACTPQRPRGRRAGGD
jgi:hypothetical protein